MSSERQMKRGPANLPSREVPSAPCAGCQEHHTPSVLPAASQQRHCISRGQSAVSRGNQARKTAHINALCPAPGAAASLFSLLQLRCFPMQPLALLSSRALVPGLQQHSHYSATAERRERQPASPRTTTILPPKWQESLSRKQPPAEAWRRTDRK